MAIKRRSEPSPAHWAFTVGRSMAPIVIVDREKEVAMSMLDSLMRGIVGFAEIDMLSVQIATPIQQAILFRERKLVVVQSEPDRFRMAEPTDRDSGVY